MVRLLYCDICGIAGSAFGTTLEGRDPYVAGTRDLAQALFIGKRSERALCGLLDMRNIALKKTCRMRTGWL